MQTAKQTYAIIKQIQSNKGVLAALRCSHCVNDASSEMVLPYMFKVMDKSELSANGTPTPEENAIFTALICYAIMKSGSSGIEYDSDKAKDLFEALNVVTYSSDDGQGIARRAVQLFNSHTPDFVMHQIVELVRIIKSAGYKAPLNYPQLADELYLLQTGALNARHIIIKWGQTYNSQAKRKKVDDRTKRNKAKKETED